MIGITPFLEVTLVSMGLSLLVSVIYRVLTNPDNVRKIKEDMKFFKEKMSQSQKAGDKAKTSEYANEMLRASQSQMKHSMKPMIVTMVVFVAILGWLRTAYVDVVIITPFTLPFLGSSIGWFWWYVFLSIPATMVFRKLLGVE